MKRIVWVSVAILIMICILGLGLHSIKQIERTNQERREREAGEQFASQVAIVTETTNIWDRVRSQNETTTAVVSTDANGSEYPAQEMQTDENGAPAEITPAQGEPLTTDAAAPADTLTGMQPEPQREQTTVETIIIQIP